MPVGINIGCYNQDLVSKLLQTIFEDFNMSGYSVDVGQIGFSKKHYSHNRDLQREGLIFSMTYNSCQCSPIITYFS